MRADLEFDLDFSIAMTTSLPLLSRARRPSAAIEEKDVSVSYELFIDFRFIRFYFSVKINEMTEIKSWIEGHICIINIIEF